MNQLSVGQRKVAAEIIGNIAVAWFTAGIISPFFIKPKILFEFFRSLVIVLIMSIFFAYGSLSLVKKVKQ